MLDYAARVARRAGWATWWGGREGRNATSRFLKISRPARVESELTAEHRLVSGSKRSRAALGPGWHCGYYRDHAAQPLRAALRFGPYRNSLVAIGPFSSPLSWSSLWLCWSVLPPRSLGSWLCSRGPRDREQVRRKFLTLLGMPFAWPNSAKRPDLQLL